MLAEVLITIAIVGMIMIPLFGLQSSLLTKLERSNDTLANLFYITILTREARNEQPLSSSTFILEKKMGDPEVQVRYSLEKPSKESSLASLDGILVEKIVIEWNEFGKKKSDHFAHIVFKPEAVVKE